MKKKEIWLIPYAHLDSQWRWEYPTTIDRFIKNTIDKNLYLFDKYQDHSFNFTGAIRYKMMQDYYPADFEKVKKLVQDGRWHLSGTCLDETDALVPSVESLIRNIMYGKNWQLATFGVTSKDYMLPDCFGFPENFPSILKHCSINGFSSQKLSWGSARGIPFEVGKWLGPDDATLISVLNPGKYGSMVLNTVDKCTSRLKHLDDLGKSNDVWKSYQYYGVGDFGGAPTKVSVKNVIKSMKKINENPDYDYKIVNGKSEDFYDNLTTDEIKNLDSVRGDFLLTLHSAGSISSQAIMKRWNRKNEQLAYVAESAAVMAEQYAGLEYPKERIEKAWWLVNGSQMHDILPGTCTPTAYEFSYNDEVLALKEWINILEDSAKSISPLLKGEGTILMFNGFEKQRTSLVEFDAKGLDSDKKYVLVDSKSNKITVSISKYKKEVSAQALITLNAFEWKKFAIEEGEVESAKCLELLKREDCFVLKNQYITARISKEGEIFSLVDNNTQKEYLKEPLAYHILTEKPSQFPAWNMDWKDRIKPPKSITTKGNISIFEDSDNKKSLVIKTDIGKSKIVNIVSLAKDSNKLSFVTKIDWRTKKSSLKLAITTAMDKPKATYNWETSRIEREINNIKQYEVPSRYWASLADKNKSLAIIEDSKYGYDRPTENQLRMTLLYTPHANLITSYSDQKTQDFGKHTIKYQLYPHDNNFAKLDLEAKSFNNPIRCFNVSSNSATKTLAMPFVEVSSQYVGILAIKKAEKEDAIVVRLYNRTDKQLDTVLLIKDVESAYNADGTEVKLNDLTLTKDGVNVSVPKCGLLTVVIKLSKKSNISCAKQQTVALAFDTTLIGENGKDGIIPRELLNKDILSGNIKFCISKSDKNAMKLNEQVLAVDTKFNTLSMLLFANDTQKVEFEMLDKDGKKIGKVKRKIYPSLGFIGQYDKRRWLLPPLYSDAKMFEYFWINQYIGLEDGYVNRDRVEWYSTHTHNKNKDNSYRYSYLYNITISLPKECVAVKLPKEDAMLICSATLSVQGSTAKTSNYLVDKFDF